MRWAGVALLALLGVSASRASDSDDHPMRVVPGGIVRGLAWGDGTTMFRGLPYAAPPVGPLRWKPPQPVVPWNGIRAAEQPGPPCTQRSYGWVCGRRA